MTVRWYHLYRAKDTYAWTIPGFIQGWARMRNGPARSRHRHRRHGR